MKTYIKPLVKEYCILPSFQLLGGFSRPDSNALMNEQGLVNNHSETGLEQLSKESLFSDFSICDSTSDWAE